MAEDAATTTELHAAWLHAADAGDTEELQRLLAAHPGLLSCKERFQSLKASTALHLCSWRNHAETAAFLLRRGAELNARDEAGMTPLQIDILRVCVEKMRPIPLLRARCIDVSSPVALAKYRRQLVRDRSTYDQIDTSTLEVLLKHDADVNGCSDVSELALLLAVDDGLTKHVKLLLAHGADVYFRDKNGRTALDIAAEHGYTDLVELFLRKYPKLLPLAGDRALRAAVCFDAEDVLELLYEPVLGLRADMAEKQRLRGQLFHTAVEYDAQLATRALLKRGVSVDTKNDRGETPLHVVCRSFECEAMLELLLTHRADGNLLVPATGYSPYHLAVQHHGLHTIEILARHGAAINLFDLNGHTPLVFAVVNGYSIETMETLIDHGGHFQFRGAHSRDAVAQLLTEWVFNLAPTDIPALVDRLLVAGCAEHDHSRCVVTALLWSKHTQDALLFLCLVLFSASPAAVETARTMLHDWLTRRGATRVVRKLVHDTLSRSHC